jgi:hypothetical protein
MFLFITGGYGAIPPSAPYQAGYPPAGAYNQGYDPSKENRGYNQPTYPQGGQTGFQQQQYGVVVQQQPATQVVLVGGCPACRVKITPINLHLLLQSISHMQQFKLWKISSFLIYLILSVGTCFSLHHSMKPYSTEFHETLFNNKNLYNAVLMCILVGTFDGKIYLGVIPLF